MNKKILISLSVIGIVAAVAIGGTYAWFKDTAKSEGNTFGTGELNIVLGGDGSESTPYFNVGNMVPGDTETAYLVIKNPNASIDSLFRVYAVKTEDLKGLSSKLKISATLHPKEYGYAGLQSAGYEIYGAEDNLFIDNEGLNSFIGPNNASDNLDAAYNWRSGDNKVGNDVDEWPLKSGYAAVYIIEISMDKDASNHYQGAIWKGNLVVDAVQSKNQEDTNWNEVLEPSEVGW